MSTMHRSRAGLTLSLLLGGLGLGSGCADLGDGGPVQEENVGSVEQSLARSFAAGSLVIPMDTTYQDNGTLKAFGLVYKLLRANVPVSWAIKTGKAQGDVDFTASGKDLKSGAAISSHGYRAGAFVIDAAHRAAALPVISAWQSANTTAVHDMAAFSADVQKTLSAAPRIAVFVDGNEDIAFRYLNAAGIQDSKGQAWPSAKLTDYTAYPDVLTPQAIRGATLVGKADGALMRSDGTPAYCQVTSMHYAEPADEEVVREVRMWLDSGPQTHAFMECHAVTTFENALNGHFLSTAGLIADGNAPNQLTNRHPDSPFAQYDGNLKSESGSVPSIGVPPGSALRSTDTTLINQSNAPITSRILWMTGFLDGNPNKGKVSYLAGHEYTTDLPISSNATTNGVRLFLDSLFESNCADSVVGDPRLSLSLSAPAAVSSSTLTYTLTYANSGPGVADSAVITDQLPAGATFVSATGGGTLSGNVVKWNLGNLAPGKSGSVSFQVTLPTNGTYSDQAKLDYHVSLTPKEIVSNTVSTAKSSTPIANLSVNVTSSPDPVSSGGTVDYTVDLSNAGPQAGPNGKVTLSLPAGASFLSSSGTGWACAATAGVVTCTTVSIPLVTAPTLTVTLRAPSGPATLNSTVSVSSDAADPQPNNNSVQVTETVLAVGSSVDAGAGVDAGSMGDDSGAAQLDSDGDGLPDALERLIGTNPFDADSDDDGVPDGQEPNYDQDTDGDGLINALDPDSDNDGLFDGTEMGLGCSNPATDLSRHRCIADADPTTKTNPLEADTDHGGVSDGSEDFNLNGRVDPGETDPTVGHGSDDASVVDTDKDGLSDGLEKVLGSNPKDADSDDDGVPDGAEPNPSDDADGDGLIDVLDVDSDNDGLFDGTELGLDCSNPATDTSRDVCRADADHGATKTSPLLWDTDGGGASDGSEDPNLNGRVDPGEQNPTLGHGDDDDNVVDTDGDGLGDALERTLGSDPHDADSDDDGLPDGKEPNPGVDEDGDGKPDILDPDSDGDGLADGTEAGLGCSGAAIDASKHLCVADADPSTTTGVLSPDTDHGGVPDGEEDRNHNGKVDPGETDPNDPRDDHPGGSAGGDGDGGAGNGGGGDGGAGDAGSASDASVGDDAGMSDAKLTGTVAGGALCSAAGPKRGSTAPLWWALLLLAARAASRLPKKGKMMTQLSSRATLVRARRMLVCMLLGSASACSGSGAHPGDLGPNADGSVGLDGSGGSQADGSRPALDAALDAADGMGMTGDAAQPMDGSPGAVMIDALTFDTAAATLHVSGSTPATMQFTALGSLHGSTPMPVPAGYQLDTTDLGTIDAKTGLFTSNNQAGGVVTVTASYGGKQASIKLTIVLTVADTVGANLPSNTVSLFDPTQNQVVTDDAAHTPALVYPVAETMFPQNLAHVLFQWRANGAKLFQLAFHSSVLDYKLYTDGSQDTCTQAGTQAACWQSDEDAWHKLAYSNAGQSVTLTLSGTDPAHPGTVYAAAPVTLSFSKEPVPGAIYYWSTTAKGVRRGRMDDLAPTNFFTPTEADGNCVACHTLSRNGKAMAADVGGENLWVVDVTKDVPPPRRFTSYQNKNIANSWATFNPDTTRVVSSTNGIMTLRDAQTGAPIGPNAGVIGLNKNLATMPDWAPDGSHVVFAMGPNAKGRKATAASIAQISADGDQFGTPEVIVASTGAADDNSWPMFDPSSQWIAFIKSAKSSEGDATAQVNIVKAEPGATPQPLTRANTLVNDQTIATGLYNNMPTWAPTQDGGLAWVAFTSTRDYGLVLASGSSFGSKLKQLWIAAIDLKTLGSGDPSYPAFHVPFQELSENSHRPFWAEDALVTEDAGVPTADAGGPLDAGPVADAGTNGMSDAGTGNGGTPDSGPPACIPENGDCSRGTCCAGYTCSPSGSSYTCQIVLY